VVVAWLWLWQAVVACRKLERVAPAQRAFYEAKLAACRYCFKYMLPCANIGFSLVEELDDTCFSLTPEQIEAA
jgi:butyryl-CoA dehydrogenase